MRTRILPLLVLMALPTLLPAAAHAERRNPLEGQPVGEVTRQSVDRVALVHAAAVPNDHEPPGPVVQQGLEEGY